MCGRFTHRRLRCPQLLQPLRSRSPNWLRIKMRRIRARAFRISGSLKPEPTIAIYGA